MSSHQQWTHSAETGMPFTHCIHCRMPLLEIDSPWLVNKEFNHGECTLEYAMCQGCRDHVSSQLSEESRAAVREFLEHEIPWEDRMADYMFEDSPGKRFDSCIVCEAHRDDIANFATSVLFDESGQPVVGPLPLMICGACGERINSRLSKATKDVWDRFMEEHFPGPVINSCLPGLI